MDRWPPLSGPYRSTRSFKAGTHSVVLHPTFQIDKTLRPITEYVEQTRRPTVCRDGCFPFTGNFPKLTAILKVPTLLASLLLISSWTRVKSIGAIAELDMDIVLSPGQYP
jgi:hypothetical protein